MQQPGQRLYNALRGSLLHPQWLSDRFSIRSRQSLRALRDSRILDIGSGNSRNIAYLHASNSVIRLDYPATNRRYDLRPDVFGDARCLPVADDVFDAIFLFEVLEHLDAPERAIREIRRALQPRGKLFVSVPFVYPIHDAPHDFQRFTIHGIRHLLQTLGFEVVQIASSNCFVSAEVLAKARWAGLRVAEVGVHHYPRTQGRSFIHPLHILSTLLELLRIWRQLHVGEGAPLPARASLGPPRQGAA